MFNTYIDNDPDPHQGGAYTAPTKITKDVLSGILAQNFLVASEKPYLKRLGAEHAETFLAMHTHTRISMPEDQRQYMKELKPELLAQLMDKKMPVIGMFIGDKMVSGCAILYPADKDIAEYLTGYDFNGHEDKTAVISAVWTHPDHTGKGHSKKVVNAGMELALFEGKEIFRAKVDKGNAPSLGLFNGFTFDTSVEGQDARKVYPILAL